MSTSRDSASDATPPPSPAPDPGQAPAQDPAPAVIRIPVTAYVAVAVLLMILSMPALAWPLYCGWMLVIPLLLIWWVARVRTTVTVDEIRVRTATGSATISWSQIKGLYFPTPRLFGISWARAVLADESRVALPAVTWQQIPELSRASRGRFPDVTAIPPADSTE
ncbi:PH domain-containing protein [Tomitella biformata]|uniref:PH domain-containing protein n=1 Tax=Tomitella biformata TaxID=630403 RepID=UPI00130E856E|nr:PH domain-containing protein [Tomitella biformata]